MRAVHVVEERHVVATGILRRHEGFGGGMVDVHPGDVGAERVEHLIERLALVGMRLGDEQHPDRPSASLRHTALRRSGYRRAGFWAMRGSRQGRQIAATAANARNFLMMLPPPETLVRVRKFYYGEALTGFPHRRRLPRARTTQFGRDLGRIADRDDLKLWGPKYFRATA